MNKKPIVTRRDFIKSSAALSAAVALSGAGTVFAQGSDKIRIGLVGCGGRGTGAAINCIDAAPGIELVAMADLFEDKVQDKLAAVKNVKPDNVNITPDRCFSGFDSYKKLIDLPEVDLVILATPPGFRPTHLAYAVSKGKHIFTEKPVAVDPAGVKMNLETFKKAKAKNLAIVAGTQRRHQGHYVELMKRIHGGAIGELVGGQCYWNGGTLWHRGSDPKWTEMEYQCRNWLYYTWLSGDLIVEQHVHNIDVLNWAMQEVPTKVMALGGRLVRTDKKWGNVYDHFACEFEYKNGARIMSASRQMAGCSNRVSERIVGTKGLAIASDKGVRIGKDWRFSTLVNPYVQEHTDLIKSIRDGKPLNELETITMSCLTAIAGRMSAYTGKEIKLAWVLKRSKLDMVPANPKPGPAPANSATISLPGVTKLT